MGKRENRSFQTHRFLGICNFLSLLHPHRQADNHPLHQRLQLVITELIRYVSTDKRYRFARISCISIPDFSRYCGLVGEHRRKPASLPTSQPLDQLSLDYHHHLFEETCSLTSPLHRSRNRNHGYLSRLSPQAIRLRRQACLLPYVEPISYLKKKIENPYRFRKLCRPPLFGSTQL